MWRKAERAMAEEGLKRYMHCPDPSTTQYRLEKVEDKYEELDQCLTQMKSKQNDIDKRLAVLVQKFDNMRYPIWVIFALALVQLARAILTFEPAAKLTGIVG